MLEIFFALMAAGMNSVPSDGAPQASTALVAPLTEAPTELAEEAPAQGSSSVQIDQNSVVIGQNTVVEGQVAGAATANAAQAATTQPSAAQAFNMSVVPAGLIAEPQTPSGKFTTAAEVKPIMNATKGNWVAVREYEGKDWLYVTHIWSWRCGLAAMAISVNGETMQNWTLPPCHEQFTTPNAILPDDGNPVLTFRLRSVETITIQVVYDDLTMDVAEFQRGNVLIP